MTDSSHRPIKRGGSWPLATALTLSFGSLTVGAVAMVLLGAVGSGIQTTREVLVQQASVIVSTVSSQTIKHLAAARDHAESLARAFAEDPNMGTHEPERTLRLMQLSFAAAPQLSGTVFIDPELQALDIDRSGDEFVKRLEDWSNDAETRAYFEEGRRRNEGYWGEPYYLPSMKRTFLNYRVPVRRGDQFIGGIESTITTDQLSAYLKQFSRPHAATAFILVGSDAVLAHAGGGGSANPERTTSEPLTPLAEHHDPVLRNLWNEAVSGEGDAVPAPPGFQFRWVELGDEENYVVVFEYLQGVGPVPWLVGSYFKTEDYQQVFRRLVFAAVAGLVMLFIVLIGIFLVGRRMARPILGLAHAAAQVGQSGPGQFSELPRSRLREIDSATTGFNEMVTGLRERERLHETFGKYVPSSVVDAIVADGGTLQPQARETTTLFTDIEGFSTVAENMPPRELIDMLNAYFAAVVEPIEAEGGVIHQFQGDAILATFNLPVPHEDHAARAIRAALAIANITREQQFAGKSLPTRVGINTGEAVCGTVGSSGRLGFTVHGDEVNLAARIEQLNKTYGTRILVAESTVQAAGDEFEFEQVAEVPIRGRTRGVVVFQVLGPHNMGAG